LSVGFALERRAQGAVARLTLDNPRKLNCLSRAMLEGLVARVREAELAPELRAVVLTGAGEKAFTGGVDVAALAGLDSRQAREFIGVVHEACAAMRECPVPVIARLNGWCIGAGLEIAAACDLRIAAEHAAFSMPEVRLGIPSVVEAALLPRLVGAGRARWLVMTGEPIGAREALAWGLVERVVPAASLDSAVNAALDALLAGEPEAIRAQKRLCKLWEEAPLEASVRASIEEFARSYGQGEPARRIDAFQRARKAKR